MSRVALVTGGSRGIGRAVALTLAEAGHRVAVNYAANAAAADEVVEMIADAGGKAVAVQGDVSSAADVAALFDRVAADLGPVEILVNNAGITRDALLLRMPQESWDEVIATNLTSNYLCSKTALRSGRFRHCFARSWSSPTSWALRLARFFFTSLRSTPIRCSTRRVTTVGRKRLRVCSVQPCGNCRR